MTVRTGVVYEDPDQPDGDGAGTWTCYACGGGAPYLRTNLDDIREEAIEHNLQHHDARLSVRCADETWGGDRVSDPNRDALLMALFDSGLSSVAVAKMVGMSQSGASRARLRILAA